MGEDWILGRLFFVIPELRLDEKIVERAIAEGLISGEDYDDYLRALRLRSKAEKIAGAVSSGTVWQRLLSLAPELVSVQTVDLLARYKLITTQEAHGMRLMLRAAGSVAAATVTDATIFERMMRISSPLVSEEFINLLRSIDNQQIEALRQRFLIDGQRQRLNPGEAAQIKAMIDASVERAEQLRGVLRAGKVLADSVGEAQGARTAWSAATFLLQGVLSEDLLRAAIKAGVIPAGLYDTILALEKAGLNIWKKGLKAAFDYDGWWARALMISEGIISPETIAALLQLGIIDRNQAQLLNAGARGVRALTRGQLGKYVASRKFRVVPGESPLQTYARVTRDTDKYLLRLLKEAADRSSKSAEAALRSGKNLTRAQQQRLVAREMQREMRVLAEGMGHMILFGEKETARGAVEAMEWLQKRVLGRLSAEEARALRLTARSGLDSFVSRQENKVRLSRLVYGNYNVWSGRIEREIQLGLLQGLSQRELAQRVARLIRPDVRGGVSYAAMRLARTEINNSFHWTSIRYTREMPWVVGYKWNLSGSHPTPDVCDQMARTDHDDLGPGVYKKKNVPGKPHPHCYCYVTVVEDSPAEFEKKMRRGTYDRYLKKTSKVGAFADPASETMQSDGGQIWNTLWKGVIPAAAKGAADVGTIIAAAEFADNLRNVETSFLRSDPVRYAQWLARRRARRSLRPE